MRGGQHLPDQEALHAEPLSRVYVGASWHRVQTCQLGRGHCIEDSHHAGDKKPDEHGVRQAQAAGEPARFPHACGLGAQGLNMFSPPDIQIGNHRPAATFNSRGIQGMLG